MPLGHRYHGFCAPDTTWRRADEAPATPGSRSRTAPLPVAEVYDWSVPPGLRCGRAVLGTVRDHAEGRAGVAHLTYEAYEE